MENFTERKSPAGLYSPQFEHDNCGIGAVVDIKGRKSHQTIDDALQIVEHLEHRAGKDAEGKTGDGVGILTKKKSAPQGQSLPLRNAFVPVLSIIAGAEKSSSDSCTKYDGGFPPLLVRNAANGPNCAPYKNKTAASGRLCGAGDAAVCVRSCGFSALSALQHAVCG